ncbi:unnamed protein product [Vitrella brassicaformis CCMP3155]|uniref:PHD-type domain-containing protein n=5 Tax=Vitrella brassicaformis TaxID=1169539 RepID=A0A0G4FN22_VITBC|nr:unnamed protein product [Vitrella brassicaformis CCMP3155]|eukprot:CEM14976.1 unnamed protein product [Vitrella brassicaformis CCMP3155]
MRRSWRRPAMQSVDVPTDVHKILEERKCRHAIRQILSTEVEKMKSELFASHRKLRQMREERIILADTITGGGRVSKNSDLYKRIRDAVVHGTIHRALEPRWIRDSLHPVKFACPPFDSCCGVFWKADAESYVATKNRIILGEYTGLVCPKPSNMTLIARTTTETLIPTHLDEQEVDEGEVELECEPDARFPAPADESVADKDNGDDNASSALDQESSIEEWSEGGANTDHRKPRSQIGSVRGGASASASGRAANGKNGSADPAVALHEAERQRQRKNMYIFNLDFHRKAYKDERKRSLYPTTHGSLPLRNIVVDASERLNEMALVNHFSCIQLVSHLPKARNAKANAEWHQVLVDGWPHIILTTVPGTPINPNDEILADFGGDWFKNVIRLASQFLYRELTFYRSVAFKQFNRDWLRSQIDHIAAEAAVKVDETDKDICCEMDDPCAICLNSNANGQRNLAVVCDGCNRCYHLRCLGVDPRQPVPKEEWFCDTCCLHAERVTSTLLQLRDDARLHYMNAKHIDRLAAMPEPEGVPSQQDVRRSTRSWQGLYFNHTNHDSKDLEPPSHYKADLMAAKGPLNRRNFMSSNRACVPGPPPSDGDQPAAPPTRNTGGDTSRSEADGGSSCTSPATSEAHDFLLSMYNITCGDSRIFHSFDDPLTNKPREYLGIVESGEFTRKGTLVNVYYPEDGERHTHIFEKELCLELAKHRRNRIGRTRNSVSWWKPRRVMCECPGCFKWIESRDMHKAIFCSRCPAAFHRQCCTDAPAADAPPSQSWTCPSCARSDPPCPSPCPPPPPPPQPLVPASPSVVCDEPGRPPDSPAGAMRGGGRNMEAARGEGQPAAAAAAAADSDGDREATAAAEDLDAVELPSDIELAASFLLGRPEVLPLTAEQATRLPPATQDAALPYLLEWRGAGKGFVVITFPHGDTSIRNPPKTSFPSRGRIGSLEQLRAAFREAVHFHRRHNDEYIRKPTLLPAKLREDRDKDEGHRIITQHASELLQSFAAPTNGRVALKKDPKSRKPEFHVRVPDEVVNVIGPPANSLPNPLIDRKRQRPSVAPQPAATADKDNKPTSSRRDERTFKFDMPERHPTPADVQDMSRRCERYCEAVESARGRLEAIAAQREWERRRQEARERGESPGRPVRMGGEEGSDVEEGEEESEEEEDRGFDNDRLQPVAKARRTEQPPTALQQTAAVAIA